MIQVSGAVSRVRLDVLRREMNEDAALRDLLLRYAGAFFGQVSQHATCNRVHSIEQRLAAAGLSLEGMAEAATIYYFTKDGWFLDDVAVTACVP